MTLLPSFSTIQRNGLNVGNESPGKRLNAMTRIAPRKNRNARNRVPYIQRKERETLPRTRRIRNVQLTTIIKKLGPANTPTVYFSSERGQNKGIPGVAR